MADKTLKIIFSGISTLWPGPPRDGDPPPDQAFVIMPADVDKQDPSRVRQANDWNTTVPDHYPFVHVAASLLVDPPPPDETVVACEGGEHFIYFFRDARIAPEPKPAAPLKYFTDPKERPLGERPGSDDVAPPDDIRWLADVRDILSKPVRLKFDPAANTVSNEAAAIVDLDGGTLRANFPGDTVNPKTFIDAQGKVVRGLKRVLADEFIIELPYPNETEEITLTFQKLRPDTPVTGPPKLVLKWPRKENTIELRIGNDPKDEVRRLETESRFDPVRLIGPVLKPREDDFNLHYNLLQIPPRMGRPVPQNDIQQCDFQGCKPKTG
jgi:hypothetical protein